MSNAQIKNLEIRKQEIVTRVNELTTIPQNLATHSFYGFIVIFVTSLNRILVLDANPNVCDGRCIWVLRSDSGKSLLTGRDVWTFEQVITLPISLNISYPVVFLTRDDRMLVLLSSDLTITDVYDQSWQYGANYLMIDMHYDMQTDVLELKPRVFEMDTLTGEEKETFRRLLSVLTFKGETTRRTRMFLDFLSESPNTEQFKKFTSLLDPIEVEYLRELYLSANWELTSLGVRLTCLNEHMLSSED